MPSMNEKFLFDQSVSLSVCLSSFLPAFSVIRSFQVITKLYRWVKAVILKAIILSNITSLLVFSHFYVTSNAEYITPFLYISICLIDLPYMKQLQKKYYAGVLNTRGVLNNWGGGVEKFKIINKRGGGGLIKQGRGELENIINTSKWGWEVSQSLLFRKICLSREQSKHLLNTITYF